MLHDSLYDDAVTLIPTELCIDWSPLSTYKYCIKIGVDPSNLLIESVSSVSIALAVLAVVYIDSKHHTVNYCPISNESKHIEITSNVDDTLQVQIIWQFQCKIIV